MNKSNAVLLLTLLLLLAIALVLGVEWDRVEQEQPGDQQPPVAVANSFDECLAAGYSVIESYPRQCQTPDGRTFVEDIGNELDKADLIRLATPRPNDTVESPLEIKGEARGPWFFEASFPVTIYDADGKELGRTTASAQREWMTEEFVPFMAKLDFITPTTGSGTLVLEKDNPSGLKEKDDQLVVPVRFGARRQTERVSLFYYNAEKDKGEDGGILCSRQGLVATGRVIPWSAPGEIEDTIRLLLKGELSEAEKQEGLTTEFPLEGFELESAALEAEGELTLTFRDPQRKSSGGACRAGILHAEIEETAKQFPQVESVRILPEDVLQP